MKLLSRLSDTERRLILGNQEGQPTPEVRATIFPLAYVLYTPFRWFFALIESILLTTVYAIHKIFGWLAAAAWFFFQCWIYSIVETLLESFFQGFDRTIMEAMPDWVSGIPLAGITGTVTVSALKSYWYGTSFVESMKWMLIFRVGFLCALQLLRGLSVLYKAWQDKIKRRD
jgi:hypothetical protein